MILNIKEVKLILTLFCLFVFLNLSIFYVLQALSIHDAAVCNCHSDNKLSDMLALVEDGYSCTSKTEADRINFGIKLQNALKDFTGSFLPHMKEEEEVLNKQITCN